MRKFLKNDLVIVIAGKDKGKQGKIQKVIENPKGNRFVVEGVNLVKKHVKPNPQIGQEGGIVEKAASINASNVAIFNPATGKADRVGFQVLEDGTKVRIFKSSKEQINN